MTKSFWHSIDTKTPVVVLYRGEAAALGSARTLGRLGVPVYLVAPRGSLRSQPSRNSGVERSKYWRERFFYDDASPAALLTFLLEVAQHLGGKPILITHADSAAIFIEQHADALAERYVFSRGPAPIKERLSNKWGMSVLAREHGIPTPHTAFPKTKTEVLDFLRSASMPIVMKTAVSSLSSHVAKKAILHTPEEVLAKWESDAAQGSPNLILQEYIPGDATSVWMCNAYFTNDSRCLAVFTGRKLRQVNDTGVASLAICAKNDDVADTTRRFMKAVGYTGPVGIGYRYDARDGKYKLLDVNVRVSLVFRLFASPNGADVVRVCYLDLTGQSVPDSTLEEGRKWMLEDDIPSAYRSMKEGKLRLGRWIASLYGVRELHWFAPDDLAPALGWFQANFVRPMWQRAKQTVRRVAFAR